ncbi:MAG TPA: ribosome biogenesis GTPase Der [Actinomycetota bacterium]|nr:ribosome biogenesis GTPase Der [Actinomycetota bacterium]
MAEAVRPAERGLPLVAVVGRPNVGKSSLVNRVLGRREAIVEETPGVTRDRRSFVAEWAGRRFEIIDTGGLEPGAKGLDARVAEQAEVAMEAADVVVLVVDASAGVLEDDAVVAAKLRGGSKPVLVVANKVDDPRDEPAAAELYKLGLGEPIPMSALHGRASGDFLERLVATLPEVVAEEAGEWGSLAIAGRPNVGKSSILNALLREERSLVDSVPGTTRDPVDSFVEARAGSAGRPNENGGRTLRIVDTAGMRRRVAIGESLEYYSWLRSRQAIQRADAVLLVVDMAEGVTSLDQRIAQDVVESGRACVIALNKWDLVPGEETDRARAERDIGERLRWLEWAKVVRTSALTRRGVDRILPAVVDALESHRRRLPTAAVNRIVSEAQARRPHPRAGHRAVRVLYAVQASAAPPEIVLFATGQLTPGYLKYLEHRIREAEPFEGTPVKLRTRIRRRRGEGAPERGG